MSSKSKGPKISKNALKKIAKANLAMETQLSLFTNFYSPQFGMERWGLLVESLKRPVKYVAMINKYVDRGFASHLLGIQNGSTIPYLSKFMNNIYIHKAHAPVAEEVPLTVFHAVSKEATKLDHDASPMATSQSEKEAADECTRNIEPPNNEQHEKQHGKMKHSTHANTTNATSKGTAQSKATTTTTTTNVLDDEDFEHPTTTTVDYQAWPAPGLATSLDPISGLCCYYPLDVASLFPVLLLDVHPYHHVLDMCSAPGGKALAILQRLDFTKSYTVIERQQQFHTPSLQEIRYSQTAALTCNDISPDRRIRLKNVMRRYIPSEYQDHIQILSSDAASPRFAYQFGEEKKFDRILLDAPCSSERHLLLGSQQQSTTAGQHQGGTPDILQWAPGRIKANAERQVALLLNAVAVCNLYGKIVYSTCALHTLENDQVIEKVMKKLQKKGKQYGYMLQVLSIPQEIQRITENWQYSQPSSSRMETAQTAGATTDSRSSSQEELPPSYTMPFGDATRYGWHILPDNSDGWGPIYLSVLQKVPYISSVTSSTAGSSDAEKEEEEFSDNEQDEDR